MAYTDKMDTGSMKKTVNPKQGGAGTKSPGEFGMGSGKSVCDGLPCDSSGSAIMKKPGDYAEHGTKAKKFT